MVIQRHEFLNCKMVLPRSRYCCPMMCHESSITVMALLLLGSGKYPTHDPWDHEFSWEYDRSRFELAGQLFTDGQKNYKAVLEGIQSDQDYLRLLFNLKTGPGRQRCCHYCSSIQWVSNKVPIGKAFNNHPDQLYTVFGNEGDRPHLSFNVVWTFF